MVNIIWICGVYSAQSIFDDTVLFFYWLVVVSGWWLVVGGWWSHHDRYEILQKKQRSLCMGVAT